MTDWTAPQDVDDVTLAFPARVVDTLLPPMDEIPEDFRRRTEASKAWYRFQDTWFYQGLGENSGFESVILRKGIDGDKAFRHLGAIQRSFEPHHEHKMAGVAWLAHLWFEKVVWK